MDRDTDSQGAPYLLQLRHPPDQLGGDRVQLQEVQPVQRALQHVDDGGQLWDEGGVSAGGPGEAREGQGDHSRGVSPVGRLHVRAPCCTVSGRGASADVPVTLAHRGPPHFNASWELLEPANSRSPEGPGGAVCP